MDLSGESALHWTVGNQTIENYPKTIVHYLLRGWADVHARNVRGQTPLNYASYLSRFPCIQLSNKYGASVFDQDIHGRTPLHLALSNERYNYAYELLQFGGDKLVDMQDSDGKTPLHLAATIRPKFFALAFVEYMLDNNSGSMHILDKEGKSPVDLVIRDRRTKRQFIKHALKLKCVNLPLLVNHEFDIQRYNFDPEIYHKEIEAMKHCKFDKYSLHDIFSKRHYPSYLNNEAAAKGMQAAIESPDFNDKFPCYFSLLRKTYKQSEQRLLLLNESLEVFDEGLPVEVWRMVLSYLDDRDLLNLLKCKH